MTGANGFIGGHLCRRLAAAGHAVIAGVRSPDRAVDWTETRVLGDLREQDDLSPAVDGCDAVVHLAARVHMMRETETDPDAEYLRANAEATENLARAAAAKGVRRFVFLSSVKVNGEATGPRPFDESDAPAPEDAYGRSKLAAERALETLSAGTGLTATSLRVPLVYGPGVGANFAALLRLCDMPLPLPLAGIAGNRRSLLFAGNLTDAVLSVLEHPRPAPGSFLLSDGEDVSTADLVRRLRRSLNRNIPDIPVPPGLIACLAGIAGKKAAADRLCGSLQVDSTGFRRAFDWKPPFSVDQGIAATAAWYRARR